MKTQIKIVVDEDYEPDDEDAECLAKEIGKLNSGEWTAYGIMILVDGHNIGDSLWGTVCESGYLGMYDNVEEIGDEYLRETARELLDETRATVHRKTVYMIQPTLDDAVGLGIRVVSDRRDSPVPTYDTADEAMQAWTEMSGKDGTQEVDVYEAILQVRQISVGRPPHHGRVVTQG